jgi:hypothetical protein
VRTDERYKLCTSPGLNESCQQCHPFRNIGKTGCKNDWPEQTGICWGDNKYNQINTANIWVRSVPMPVHTEYRFMQMSPGFTFTCALEAVTHKALCWGRNQLGQLGSNMTDIVDALHPVPVAGNYTFSFLSSGYSHTCGLVWQGGNNTNTDNDTDTDTDSGGGLAVCWGDNKSGQLGEEEMNDNDNDGGIFYRNYPVPVAGEFIFSTLTTGRYHTCGLLASSRAALCWGKGTSGQLGHGVYVDSRVPVEVQGGMSFVDIAAGKEHTCGLLSSSRNIGNGKGNDNGASSSSSSSTSTTPDGRYRCWGSNVAGQLGVELQGIGRQALAAPQPDDSSSSSGRLGTGAIIAIAVGASVAAVTAIAVVGVLKRKRTSPNNNSNNNAASYHKSAMMMMMSTSSSYNTTNNNNSGKSADWSDLTLLPTDTSITNIKNNNIDNDSLLSTTIDNITTASTSIGVDTRLWEFSIDELKVGRLIGQGRYGRVFSAQWHEIQVAAKLLRNDDNNNNNNGSERSGGSDTANNSIVIQKGTVGPEMLRRLQVEASLMASLRHPNIAQFLGVCTNPPCILLEYYDRGSLADVLRMARECGSQPNQHQQQHQQQPQLYQVLTWRLRVQMALEAAQGMLFLHNQDPKIIHRDLKPANLLVDKAWRIKITDFNLGRIVGEEEEEEEEEREGGEEYERGTGEGKEKRKKKNVFLSLSGMDVAGGNPRWTAPELLISSSNNSRSKRHSTAGDVFAYGVVLWELMTWQFPWEGYDASEIADAVGRGERLRVPRREEMPGPDGGEFGGYDGYVRLMEKCWAQKAGDRPGFGDIIGDIRKIKEAL